MNLWLAFLAFLGILIVIRHLVERRFPGQRPQMWYTAIGMSGLAAVVFGLGIYLATLSDLVGAIVLGLAGLVAAHGAAGVWLGLAGRPSEGWHLGLLTPRSRGGD